MFLNTLIIEEHHITSDSIAWILSDGGLNFCYIPVSTFTRAEQVLSETAIDLALIDLNLCENEVCSFCRKLKLQNSPVKILIIANVTKKGILEKLINTGIEGIILKSCFTAELVDAVHEIVAGGKYIGKGIMDILDGIKLSGYPMLTKREKEILGLIAAGHTNPEISQKLFISHFTVDSHRKNLLQKFNTRNTATLIRKAMMMGVIEFEI